jgi:hypothetical protein
MQQICLVRALVVAAFHVSATTLVMSASTDADWPCIQRKVPELSLGQIWTGPELPKSAANWSKNTGISTLVQELAIRRLPIGDAQKKIRELAAGMPSDLARVRLTMLVQGLFDHMNAERSQVMSGIARYARKQAEMASLLREEASKVDALRATPDTDANEIAMRTDRLTWQIRIFEERAQSLSYVCEVPTLIEQRLYALAKTIAESLDKLKLESLSP